MIDRQALCPRRIRRIGGSFAFLEHRFLRDGFWAGLSQHELILYFFLVLAADRQGLSYYGFDKICTLCSLAAHHYLAARDGLIDHDLIAFDGRWFQVLSLPDKPLKKPAMLLRPGPEMAESDPATIRESIRASLRGDHD